MPLPKGVRSVKSAGGRTYYYHRATGARLPDDPSSPEFVAAIEAAKAGQADPVRAGTIAALIREYRLSPAYRKLGRDTQVYYDRMLEYLHPYLQGPIHELRRRHIIKLRDSISVKKGDSTANHFVSVVSVLMRHAIRMEYRESNPCQEIDRVKGGSYARWSDAALAYAMTPGNLPEQFRRAVVLGIYTGQRAGDLRRMRWDAIRDGGIQVRQAKTAAELWIPIHPELAAELKTWGRDAVTILTTSRGTPWGERSFNVAVSREFRRLDDKTGERVHIVLAGLAFHGIRKAAAARLAEAGCSTKEIASVTGHRSLQMVEHYTRQAEQRTLATAAIIRLGSRNKA